MKKKSPKLNGHRASVGVKTNGYEIHIDFREGGWQDYVAHTLDEVRKILEKNLEPLAEPTKP